jgi:hypothetical protein
LLASNKNRRNTSIKNNFVQIVGHTEIKSIDMVAMKKTLGGKYYMIDALAERQYLVYDEKLSVGSINPKN